jgi:hypothetical protein
MKKQRSGEATGASAARNMSPLPDGLTVDSLRRTYAFAGKVLARSGVHMFDANNEREA